MDISKIQTKPLTAEEEAVLLDRAAAGDAEAEAELVRRNLGLVGRIARRYQSSGASREDLLQEGRIGLLNAIRKYDPARGVRLTTLAGWWIRQAISRFVKGPTRDIRLPEGMHDRIARLRSVRATLRSQGKDPELSEIADTVGLPENKVRRALESARDTLRLEAPSKGGGGALRVGDTLFDAGSAPEDKLAHQYAQHKMLDELKNLSSREVWLLAHRFGLADGQSRSRAWIARCMGVSAERVRQLERRALKTLRKGVLGA